MMKRERRAAPAGSNHQMLALAPMKGKRRERVLKMTSVLQSRGGFSFDGERAQGGPG